MFTKAQVMALYEVADATIERYLSSHGDELKSTGYQVIRGEKLKQFKSLASGTLIKEGTKTTALGLFSFRAVMNIGMLLTESEPARLLRYRLLNIVLDVMHERVGGHTKFINQRDENYLVSALQEENYRRLFTDRSEEHTSELQSREN